MDFERGGQSPAQFAAARGVRVATLLTWLSRYRKGRRLCASRETHHPVRFVAVEPTVTLAPQPEILVEVVVAGLRVRIPVCVGASLLADFVQALAQSRC